MSHTQGSTTDPLPVIIVGAGPVGLTAATLLGQYGVHCLILDRWEGVYPQPRVVHLDDEIYRSLRAWASPSSSPPSRVPPAACS